MFSAVYEDLDTFESLSNCSYYSVDSFNEVFSQDSSKNYFIFHHNIRSFRRNSDELFAYIDLLKVKFQVLVFTETWFSRDNIIEIDGYKSYHSFRNEKIGGGVSVYVTDTLVSLGLDDLTINNEVIETCCVKISYNSSFLYVICLYRPPNMDFYDLFLDNCSNFLTELMVLDRNFYVLGDFNVNTLSSGIVSTRFVDLMRSFSMMPLVSVPTRITDNVQSLIDNIWTNDLASINSGVLIFDVTDHFPIFLSLPLGMESDKIQKKFRDHSLLSI